MPVIALVDAETPKQGFFDGREIGAVVGDVEVDAVAPSAEVGADGC